MLLFRNKASRRSLCTYVVVFHSWRSQIWLQDFQMADQVLPTFILVDKNHKACVQDKLWTCRLDNLNQPLKSWLQSSVIPLTFSGVRNLRRILQSAWPCKYSWKTGEVGEPVLVTTRRMHHVCMIWRYRSALPMFICN